MKMKTILFLIVATASLSSYAQKSKDLVYPNLPVDEKTKLITYEGVGKLDGVSAKELYGRALEWIKTYHKNPTEKIRKQDEENGEIEVFARFPIFAYDKKGVKTTSNAGLIQYTMVLQFKDGRYKYVVSSLNYKAPSYQPIDSWLLDKENDPNADNHAYQLADIDLELKAMIKDMKSKVAAKADAKGDDW